MPFRLQAHGASDVGLVRVNNEDAWLISLEKQIFLLADGLGGHQAGEVAAREAMECFFAIFSAWKKEQIVSPAKKCLSEEEIEESLRACFAQTNAYLFQLSFSHELLRGMGTTFCSLSFHGQKVAVAHVGDSRIYLLRGNALEQLTKDHCWTKGFFSEQIAEDIPHKGVLTRALGTTPKVEPTIKLLEVHPNDLFLLCSDGLSDMLEHEEIEKILRMPLTIGERVRTLISTAKANGGGDNVTVVLVDAMEEDAKDIS
jgi:PPM family protein phosphatase